MSVSVKKLSKAYGSQQVLRNVNFNINDGEIVGFIGPNGAGKSTTMKCITGYIPYIEGSIEVCGIEVEKNSIETKRLIGYLPEHNPLYLEMYVKEYLQFVGGLYHLGKKINSRVDEIIELTGLTKEYRKPIGQLSKGYRQRVGIAQALIHDPKVLILDEPTTGLDPNQLIEVRNLISEIGKEKTVMLSTHIMQEVSAICSRIIIINGGQIVADGSEQQILDENASRKRFFVETLENTDANLWRKISAVEDVIYSHRNAFEIVATKDLRKEIFLLAKEENITLLTLCEKTQNIEDAFHILTQ